MGSLPRTSPLWQGITDARGEESGGRKSGRSGLIFTVHITCSSYCPSCKPVPLPQGRNGPNLDDGPGRAVARLCVPSPAALLQIFLRRKPPTAQIRNFVLSATRKASRAAIPDCPARPNARRLLNLWRALVCMPSLPSFPFKLTASPFYYLPQTKCWIATRQTPVPWRIGSDPVIPLRSNPRSNRRTQKSREISTAELP